MIHPTSARVGWKSDGISTYCRSIFKLFRNSNKINVLPVPEIPIVKCKYLKNYFKWKELKSIISNSNADIVHINGYTSLMSAQPFWALRKSGKKIVYSAHWHPFRYLGRPFLGKTFFYLIMKPLIKKYADTIITINNEDTIFFKKFHNNVVQIPHSIPSLEKGVHVCTSIKDPKMILFVGNMKASNKGAEYIYHLPEGKYNIHCVSANILQERSDLTVHSGISSEELRKLYERASLLIVPSKYEAFSYVTLEALAAGTPVVMSDRVRIADYLEGIRGYSIFKYGDYKGFVEAVSKTIGMAVDTHLIMQRFSDEAVKKAYETVYLSTFLNNSVMSPNI